MLVVLEVLYIIWKLETINILKYDNDSKNFRQEILIHLEITENTRSTLLPNIVNYGFLKGDGIIYNSNYLYYITDYIEDLVLGNYMNHHVLLVLKH